jgi:hypothetical protein
MKLLVLSDLHLELGTSLTLPSNDPYDAVVLAGDIHSPGRKAVHWAQRQSTFGGKPVLLVAGNHEFYNGERTAELREMKRAADGSNVHVLDRSVAVVGDARFVGCTLWTDFQLPVLQGDGSLEVDVGRALAVAARRTNDFRLIEESVPAKRQYRERQFRKLLEARDTLGLHWEDRDWLRRELEAPFEGATVVITHHGPAMGSVAARYASDWLTPAFVSDLPDSFFRVPVLWVHGHMHSPFDYRRSACRVISNPRGYRTADGTFENATFAASFIVEVAAHAGTPSFESVPLLLRVDHVDARAECADMVDEEQAAVVAGLDVQQLRRRASMKHPQIIRLKHSTRGWRYPRWQFEAALRPLVGRLAQALQEGPLGMLAWMETPLGALNGRTPRTAVEQGESVESVLAMASGATL